MKIEKITACEILDSRANPTISCSVYLKNGFCGRASVPSGASVGEHEAIELRDGDKSRYGGRGVLKAIEKIEKVIAPALIGKEVDVLACDEFMISLDGTKNKSNLGANSMLAVSMAVARAQSLAAGEAPYKVLARLSGAQAKLPCAMFNILNGGVHANNKILFQEFMIMPVQTKNFARSLEMAVSVYKNLKKLLYDSGYSINVGDEGGFAPVFAKNQTFERRALDFICKSVELAGFKLGEDIVFCLDVAASQFFSKDDSKYNFYGDMISSTDLVDFYKSLIRDYPIYSIEDGLDENDWDGFALLTKELGKKIMLVGDDIFVTNVDLIKKGIELKVANSVLIKPNQIGTVFETLSAIKTCKDGNYKTVASHRSGETNDSFIADLAVGAGTDFCKFGAPARGERVAKYNRLLEISTYDF
jgi:enolase